MKTALECCGGNRYLGGDRRCRTEILCVKSKAQLEIDAREEKQEENSVEWPTFRGVCDEGQKPG